MSDSLALAYAMKRRAKKMADGGMVQKEQGGKEPAVEPGSDTDKAFKSIRAAFGNPDKPPIRKATGGIVEAIRAKRAQPEVTDEAGDALDSVAADTEELEGADVDAILKELYAEEAAEPGAEDSGHTDMISAIRKKFKAKGSK